MFRTALLLLAVAVVAGAEPLVIRDGERVVFLGDSITERNLPEGWAGVVEAMLALRLPDRQVTCWNLGWGGDTAPKAVKRFARDVAPLRPTLVVVGLGMNDGGFAGFDAGRLSYYLSAQRELAAAVRGLGARGLWLTPTPVDGRKRSASGFYKDLDRYPPALERFADGLLGLVGELGAPVVDLYHPLAATIAEIQVATPAFSLAPRDGVHPDAVGHLLIARQVLAALALPRSCGSIAIRGGRAETADGAVVADLARDGDGLSFALTPGSLPFPVPRDARPALTLVPFQREWNALDLAVDGLEPAAAYRLTVDDAACGRFTGAELAAGIDAALLDEAPWLRQARACWDTAVLRARKHQEAWRRFGVEPGPLAALPSLPALVAAQNAFVADLEGLLAAQRRPARHRIRIARLPP